MKLFSDVLGIVIRREWSLMNNDDWLYLGIEGLIAIAAWFYAEFLQSFFRQSLTLSESIDKDSVHD